MNSTARTIIAGLCAAWLAAVSAGCGEEFLTEMKNFEANASPVITLFTTDIVPGTELYPGMQAVLTVEAHDIEGDAISYGFSSPYGTMRDLLYTAGGCTIEYFIKSTCPTSASIPITVTAIDAKGATSSLTIDIGDGRTGPAVTGTWSGGPVLMSGQTVTVNFSADCTGYYQARVQSPPAGNAAFDLELKTFFYNTIGETKTVVFTAISGTDETTNLPAVGTYRIYILVRDKFGRQGHISTDVTVE